MGFLSRNKPEKKVITEINSVDMNIGTVTPFTALTTDVQFSNFVAELCNNKTSGLTDEEKGAFDTLWKASCVGGPEYGLSNLRMGRCVIYNLGNVMLGFVKKHGTVRDEYGDDDGRVTFYYQSPDGNIAIQQHERNKEIMLVYVSENINSRLLNALLIAESNALGIKYDGYKEDNVQFGMPIEASEDMRRIK